MFGATTSSWSAVVDPFALQTQQRQRGQPLAVAGLAIGDGDGRVPIIVAVDEPFEPEIDQRRRIDHELAGPRRIRGDHRASRSVKTTQTTSASHAHRAFITASSWSLYSRRKEPVIRRTLWIGFALVGMALLVWLASIARRGAPTWPVADGALIEIYTIHAARGEQLLGAYSSTAGTIRGLSSSISSRRSTS